MKNILKRKAHIWDDIVYENLLLLDPMVVEEILKQAEIKQKETSHCTALLANKSMFLMFLNCCLVFIFIFWASFSGYSGYIFPLYFTFLLPQLVSLVSLLSALNVGSYYGEGWRPQSILGQDPSTLVSDTIKCLVLRIYGRAIPFDQKMNSDKGVWITLSIRLIIISLVVSTAYLTYLEAN